MLPVHFVNVLWGRSFTDLFLEVSLPTQLASGNLGAVYGRPGARYDLYTTAEDEERIRFAPEFTRLCETLPTFVHRIDVNADTPHWQTLTNCHKDAIGRAQSEGAALVFMTPDIVLGNGAVDSLLRWAEGGMRAVMIGSVRLVRESFAREFTARYRRGGEIEVGVPPREMVGMALRHLHQISAALIWPPKTTWPSHVYWNVPSEGLIARCFHAHPMMVVTRQQALSFDSTIDGDYLEQAGVRPEEIHVVDDTDDLTLFELSPETYTMGPRATPMKASEVGLWASLYANRLHRQMFRRPIAVHRGELGRGWQAAQITADRDYRRVQWWLNNWLVRLAVGVVFKPVRDRLAVVYRATWKRPSVVAARQKVRSGLGRVRRGVGRRWRWLARLPKAIALAMNQPDEPAAGASDPANTTGLIVHGGQGIPAPHVAAWHGQSADGTATDSSHSTVHADQ